MLRLSVVARERLSVERDLRVKWGKKHVEREREEWEATKENVSFTKEFQILSFLKEFEILIFKLVKIPDQNTKILISFQIFYPNILFN